MDNFNVSRDQDEFLDVMLKCRCRILFSTRSRYENQISLEVAELPVDSRLELMGKFYDAGRKNGLLEAMIGLLHGHTYAVKLAARLLSNGMLKPEMYYLRRFTDKGDLIQAIENYIHFYNNGRFQKRLRCMTPMEFLMPMWHKKFPPCCAAGREHSTEYFVFSTVYLTGGTSQLLSLAR